MRKKLSKKYVWSVNEMCLAEHLLVGPFDFISLPDLEAPKKMEDRQVDRRVWEWLITICQQRGLDTKEINHQSEVFLGMKLEWCIAEWLGKE